MKCEDILCICPCHGGKERCWCKHDGVPHGALLITDEQIPKKRWDYHSKGTYKDRLIDIE